MSTQENSASYILQSFLLNKRSIKKIFGLNLSRIGLLTYLCASMDVAYKKTKKLITKLYESQICRHCHCDPKTLRHNRSILIKKKLIKFDSKKRTYELGLVLKKWGISPVLQDIGKISRDLRSRENLPISNSSYISNTKTKFENQTPRSKEWTGMAPTAKNVSTLLQEHINKTKGH